MKRSRKCKDTTEGSVVASYICTEGSDQVEKSCNRRECPSERSNNWRAREGGERQREKEIEQIPDSGSATQVTLMCIV